jgi:hypothetical protein
MYTLEMSKMYVKDPDGKYRLVDKETQTSTGTNKVETKEPTPEAKAWIREIMEGPKMKELEARVKRLESIVIDPRK